MSAIVRVSRRTRGLVLLAIVTVYALLVVWWRVTWPTHSAACRGVFSPGQQKRMRFLWRTARGGKSDIEVTDEPLIVEDDAADGGCSATGHGSIGGALVLGLAALVGGRRRRRA